MALVVIHAPKLTSDQKKRIGDRVFEALHSEGISASSTILLFKREEADILLDGGLLVEANSEIKAPEEPAPVRHEPSFFQPLTIPPAAVPDYKIRARRTKAELSDLKGQLVTSLQMRGHLSSFQAQEILGLKDCEWAPATLRRLFSELEDEGLIAKQGQKRGTRYVWNGITSHTSSSTPILVKRDNDLLDEDEDEVVLVGQE
ncbi:hypothetical protein [Holophaga foetida]|uniref:hypothetical protein n=1 Tax=Holophaga foetida TaxID=35839 RepID=UPI0002474A46|nr:hypothetical protein [Holophaga foetida]